MLAQGLSRVEEFGEGVNPDDPRLLAKGGHPVLRVHNYQRTVVPLWVHGDGVQYGEEHNLMTYTCGSVITNTSSMHVVFHLAAFVKKFTATRKHGAAADTWEEIWKILSWSFRAAYEGKHPRLDWEGKPLDRTSRFYGKADLPLHKGYRFLVWNVLGDWEFDALALGLPHWGCNEFCFSCNCSRVEPARDWRVNWGERGWRQRDPSTFHVDLEHRLFSLPGVTSWCVCYDILHNLDTHGLASHMIGSMLHQLIREAPDITAGKAASTLSRIWVRIQELYDDMDVRERLTHLHLSNICDSSKPLHAGYPTLTHVKGAETRHLVPVIAQLAQEDYDLKKTARAQRRLAALKALTSFYAVVDASDMFMPAARYDAALKFMECFLANYSWLHQDAQKDGEEYFKLVPKTHTAWHLGFNCRFMNPRFCWTYKCESWVGEMSQLAASCSSGTRMTRLTVPLAEKYVLKVHIHLERECASL